MLRPERSDRAVVAAFLTRWNHQDLRVTRVHMHSGAHRDDVKRMTPGQVDIFRRMERNLTSLRDIATELHAASGAGCQPSHLVEHLFDDPACCGNSRFYQLLAEF